MQHMGGRAALYEDRQSGVEAGASGAEARIQCGSMLESDMFIDILSGDSEDAVGFKSWEFSESAGNMFGLEL